jgi:hypothetical protein
MNLNNIYFVIILLIIFVIIIDFFKKKVYDFYFDHKHLSLQNVIKTYDITSNNKSYNYDNKNNKNNIIFFLSFDYETLPSYYYKMLKILNDYCNYHNNKLYIFDHYNDTNKISPYWNKVADFIKLSNSYKESPNTIIVYLDIDTCINPKYFNLSISNIIDTVNKIENKIGDIYIGNDPSPSEAGNAGVIIIRNTDWSKQFLNLWWSKYNHNNWKIINNKWVCRNQDKLCNWAGNDYEQGEFNNIYKNNDINSKDHIIVLNYSIISNNNFLTDAFIYHFHSWNEKLKHIPLNIIYNKYV